MSKPSFTPVPDGFSVNHATSPIVRVIVGHPQKHQEIYNLHLALLCAKSKYFNACLQGHFHESSIHEVKLPDIDAHLFALFVKWLYTEDIAPFARHVKLRDIAAMMVDAYVLGDRLLCSGFKDRAMDILQESLKRDQFQLQLILQALSSGQTLTESKLMDYLFQQLAFEIVWGGLKQFTNIAGDGRWLDLLRALDATEVTDLMQRIEYFQKKGVSRHLHTSLAVDPAVEEGCEWHEHAMGKLEDCTRWHKALRREEEKHEEVRIVELRGSGTGTNDGET